MRKTISKKKSLPRIYNKDLVEFMKKVYSKIIVDICNVRKHDEDNSCDFECVGMKKVDEMIFKDKSVKIVYLPVSGNDGWCEEAVFYVNFPSTVKFSDSTLKMIKLEFEKIKNLVIQNFNEIRQLSGGYWYEQFEGPITFRKLLGLCYDLYYSKESECWKLKFKPGDKIGASDGGRWIPYDVLLQYRDSYYETKEQLFSVYADSYKKYGYLVCEAIY